MSVQCIFLTLVYPKCRALSAAIFDGNISKVEYAASWWSDQWAAIHYGEIDVSTSQVTFSMVRDIREPGSGFGMSYSTPYLYTGTKFAGNSQYVDCADEGDTLRGACAELKVCVIEATSTENHVSRHLDDYAIIKVPNRESLFQTMEMGDCNVVAGEPLIITEKLARGNNYTGEYVFGSRYFSKDPLALVTRDGDPEFANFCNWIVISLFAAEAMNISKETAEVFPSTNLFGEEYRNMSSNVIAAIGNYGEFFEKFFANLFPREGLNSINNGTSGMMYSYPFGIS